MNLIELYDSLSFPEEENINTFNALPISDYPQHRIAIDIEGNPVLLLSVVDTFKNTGLKNFRLKYLQLKQNVECKITEKGNSCFQTFTIIAFTCSDRNLQEYFLRISETLVKTLSNRPSQQKVIEALDKFVEIFRSLTDTPTNTVHGLWSELFLIANSTNPRTLVNYWHNLPEEKFDFNSGEEKIEVKSNSNFERIHIFSSEQLNPPPRTQVLIASIFVRQHSSGINIQQLVDSITDMVQNDIDLTYKLNSIVFKTLGNSLEQSIKIKFDYNIAKVSLLYYRHQDINKIEEINIPNEVSEVKYKSDLTNLRPIKINELKIIKQLFAAI
ncbi:MAG: PD-(D/E)XK motif protein [Ignavibacteriaceae bacterium]|jgi:hypothetical protein